MSETLAPLLSWLWLEQANPAAGQPILAHTEAWTVWGESALPVPCQGLWRADVIPDLAGLRWPSCHSCLAIRGWTGSLLWGPFLLQ